MAQSLKLKQKNRRSLFCQWFLESHLAMRVAYYVVGRSREDAVIMIMALNSQEYFRTRALYPETVIHLQWLVLLNADSRDAYRAASELTKDARLIAFAEYVHLERQIQAVTLQNILWDDGNESTSRVCIEPSDHGIPERVKALPETALTSIIQGLLDIDDYVYSCYEKVIRIIQGQGIRQLLSEQAARINELRPTLTELLRRLDARTPNQSSMETVVSSKM